MSGQYCGGCGSGVRGHGAGGGGTSSSPTSKGLGQQSSGVMSGTPVGEGITPSSSPTVSVYDWETATEVVTLLL
jgi:hypothetical protein